MTDTPEHEPSETAARPSGLAGGAARALRAARQSTPAEAGRQADTTLDATPADEDGSATADTVPARPTDTADTADTAVAAMAATDTEADVVGTNAAPPADDDPDAPPVLATVRDPKRSKTQPTKTATTKVDAAEIELVASEPKDTARSRMLALSAMITAAALVFAVIAVVIWWRAGHNDTRAAAAARDDVAVDARLAIATVNTSDYRKPANALTNWIDVATGSLEKQFTTSRASATTLLAQAKKVTTATVLDVAVTALDGRSASVIASVNVKQQPVTGAASTVRNRFRATMTKVGDEWKLADLAQVDVQLS